MCTKKPVQTNKENMQHIKITGSLQSDPVKTRGNQNWTQNAKYMDYKYLPFCHAYYIALGIGGRCGHEMKFLFLINFEQVSEIKIYHVAVLFAIVSADNLGAAPFPTALLATFCHACMTKL